MREILFRGKRANNGEWVEGGIIPLDTDSGYIFIAEPFLSASTLPVYEIIKHYTHLVIPETVSQYTGLNDKNGKKIFEGDIVKHYHDKKFPESYSKGYIFWDEEYLHWKRTSENVNYCIANDCIYEVIGNIHDNPELIKV